MTKSKRVMRRLILSKLYDLLQEQSPVFYARETFLDGELSLHDLDAILAFKYDVQMEELRSALDRLDAGTFGVCLSCKSPMNQQVLDDDPTQRICTTCERKYIHMSGPQLVHHHAVTI